MRQTHTIPLTLLVLLSLCDCYNCGANVHNPIKTAVIGQPHIISLTAVIMVGTHINPLRILSLEDLQDLFKTAIIIEQTHAINLTILVSWKQFESSVCDYLFIWSELTLSL